MTDGCLAACLQPRGGESAASRSRDDLTQQCRPGPVGRRDRFILPDLASGRRPWSRARRSGMQLV
jgi:hypothetical protein